MKKFFSFLHFQYRLKIIIDFLIKKFLGSSRATIDKVIMDDAL